MKLKHYEVRAQMSVILRTLVTAANEEHALAQAKVVAECGCMDELPNSGAIIDWEVFGLPKAEAKQEARA